jgi:hypothetical protein
MAIAYKKGDRIVVTRPIPNCIDGEQYVGMKGVVDGVWSVLGGGPIVLLDGGSRFWTYKDGIRLERKKGRLWR